MAVRTDRLNWQRTLVAVFVSCLTATVMGQEGASTRPAAELPVLAILMDTEVSGGDPATEDILLSEMASQAYMRLVSRAELTKVIQEHSFSLAGLAEHDASTKLGKIVGAEYLLFVRISSETATARLVEVSTGKVLMEEEVKLRPDLMLAAAALRENTLAALKLTSDRLSRLTVGIAAFPNRSGTDRSDKLGAELHKALRARLQRETWAVVLEREYPTGLLEEVELTRLGLAKGAAEQLPPADMVILGTLEDASPQYAPDKPWEIKLDLAIRLHGQSVTEQLICRSDRLEAAVEEVAKKVIARQQNAATTQPLESEKDYWRRQALYLMPRSSYYYGRDPFMCRSEREKEDAREAVRAWENLLLLDADNVEAKVNLGVCLVSLYRYDMRAPNETQTNLAIQQCLRGSRLVEQAMRTQPDQSNAATFQMVAGGIQAWLPQRTVEMYEYIVANPDRFPDSAEGIKRILSGLKPELPFELIDSAVVNVGKDPDALGDFVFQLRNRRDKDPDRILAYAAKHASSANPVVRFYFEYLMAEILCRDKKAPEALDHYDRAIAVLESAAAAVKGRGAGVLFVDDVYQHKISACKVLGKPESIRTTAVDGARHFMAVERFNQSIQWLYSYCLTDVLMSEADDEEALAICEAHLAATRKNPGMQNDNLPTVVERREELLAKANNTPMPSFENMILIRGTETKNLASPRMATSGGRLWIAWQAWQSGGPAMVYRPGSDAVEKLTDLPTDMRSVAVVKSWVFFGGMHGLYKLNIDGKVVKHFSKSDGTLPSDHIVDLREGDGQLYMSFRESDRYGVAVMDVDTDVLTILAPSNRQVTLENEPVYDVYRLWWDAANSRLCANGYVRYAGACSLPYRTLGWMQQGGGWRLLDLTERRLRLIVSDGTEALKVVCLGEEARFEFVKSGQTIECQWPLPYLIGEPAWDAKRLWVPGFMGLYEIDRQSGVARLVAHQSQNSCLDVVRLGDDLYVATRKGLYRWAIPTTN